MSHAALEAAIEAAWEARDGITTATKGEARDAIEATLSALDNGSLRVAEKRGSDWHVNQWAKKAVLLSFRLTDMYEISGSNGGANWGGKGAAKGPGGEGGTRPFLQPLRCKPPPPTPVPRGQSEAVVSPPQTPPPAGQHRAGGSWRRCQAGRSCQCGSVPPRA